MRVRQCQEYESPFSGDPLQCAMYGVCTWGTLQPELTEIEWDWEWHFKSGQFKMIKLPRPAPDGQLFDPAGVAQRKRQPT